jgi:glyoxylase-like metal-dependent hydrolase (beta-lactamase superfamily II)
MDRRRVLKFGALASGLFVLPGLTGTNAAELTETISQGYIRLQLNEVALLLFSDGQISLNNPQPVFAPGINPNHVKTELRKIFLAEDKLDTAINVMVLKIGDHVVLIDTGSGYHFGQTSGWLLKNLEASGIKAKDITDIFITHAHIDHIGGILDKEKAFVYPNARYHLAKTEYNFWMSENPDFSKSKNTTSPQESINFAKDILRTIKDRLTLFDYGTVLFSCIKTELAQGHTPGHTLFTVFSGNKSIKHIVDTFHTPLLIARPEWGTQWDIDFDKGISTRKQILESCYQDRTLIMTTHLPWPGLGYIGKNEQGSYQWISYPYFTPDRISIMG